MRGEPKAILFWALTAAAIAAHGAACVQVNNEVGTPAEEVLNPALSKSLTSGTSGTSSPTPNASPSPAKLALSGAATATAGACSGAITVSTRDSSGSSFTVSSGTAISLNGASYGTFYSESGCGVALTGFSIDAGKSEASFYLKDTRAEALSLVAESGGITSASLSFTVSGGAVATFAVSTVSATTAGSCAAMVITPQDQYGNAPGETFSVTVSGLGSAQAYAGSGCISSGTSFPLAGSSGTFYFKDTKAESLSVTLATGAASVTQAVTIQPDYAASFSVGTLSRIDAAQCAPITLSVLDAYGNAAPYGSGTAISLTGYGNGSFSGNNFCGSNLTSTTIAGSATALTLSYANRYLEAVTLSFDDGSGGLPTATLALSTASSQAIDAGSASTCALRPGGTLKCFGSGASGRLGSGDNVSLGDQAGEMGANLPVVSLGGNFVAVQVSVGDAHACALNSFGKVKCWGNGGKGRLGSEATANLGDGDEMGANLAEVGIAPGMTMKGVFAGRLATCALTTLGSLKCWGGNLSGQLGLGDSSDKGDGPSEMGNSLPYVALGTNRVARGMAISSPSTANSNDTVCVLLDTYETRCWGDGTYGLHGAGHTNNLGDSPSETGDGLAPVQFGTNRSARILALGDSHGCAILDEGSLKCWGLNDVGQLGLGDLVTRGDSAGEMGDALAAVSLGANRTTKAVAAGGGHTCAILDEGSLKCWGLNGNGQLGQGDSIRRGDDPGEMGPVLPSVFLGTGRTALKLTAGDAHTCALLDNYGVKCWGNGGTGQLGTESTFSKGDAAAEMQNLSEISF